MKPLPGNYLFEALKDEDCIIMACNARVIPGVAKGLMRAAKDTDSPIIFELARTESNLEGGYTGLTPQMYSDGLNKIADELSLDVWSLHADHIGIKKGTPEEIADVKKLVKGQIDAGYTSFAIDASHLFNFDGKNEEEELKPNIDATITIGKFIQENMKTTFGLEVEVGEIGRTDNEGMILTKPTEAVVYINKLKEAGINPNVLAIANGSTHGNIYDEDGNLIPLSSIDIEQTKAIAQALRDAGHDVRIAQHGITGTPLSLIKHQFPKKDILKGNVATLWQNIVFDTIKNFKPDLYDKIFKWVMATHPIEGKKDIEVFGKRAKFAIRQFFDEINSLPDEILGKMEQKCYDNAVEFFDSFNSKGKATVVKNYIKEMGLIK